MGILCGPGQGVSSCLATASLCTRLSGERMVFLPSSLITMEAPGWTLGPLSTAWRSSFTFHGVTGCGSYRLFGATFPTLSRNLKLVIAFTLSFLSRI
ncbi:hypothetical protein EYF80_023768 [Liparis tanakae]|uniref:Uncharacterized protein n=1 Tax=Liparis tanakae TaxID=230148 RepID=A0A4Z2HMJ6_9TELE|nr:hypothetical protein EYF80_023768 [Liparis tanakae]